ncbi:MAG: hypothetical protein FH749_12305 [Firmicutes bacterium]|nr:hypothetical protein [Bacillota bacterium]
MKKRGFISVVAAVIVVTMLFTVQTILPAGAAPAGTGLFEGEGTKDDPYLVESKDDLNNVRDYPDKHFRQTQDILFTDADFEEDGAFHNGGQGWVPIESFSGTYDGNGKRIENLTLNRNESYVGLFAVLDEEAEISNVTLLDVEVKAGNYVGGLAGWNEGKISNSTISGKVSGGMWVGGLVGENSGTIESSEASNVEVDSNYPFVGGLVGYNTGNIENSEASNVKVQGIQNVGGLVGTSSGIIENSSAQAEIQGGPFSGGLVGSNSGIIIHSAVDAIVSCEDNMRVGGLVGENSGDIENSVAEGKVHGHSDTGGLAGWNSGTIINSEVLNSNVTGRYETGGLAGSNSGTIEDSTALAKVDGERNIGGLVGQNGNYNGDGSIIGSEARGDVQGINAVGGLVGSNGEWGRHGSIIASSAFGDILGDSDVGGLVGQNFSSVTNSEAQGDVHGRETVGGLVGYNTDSGSITESFAIGLISGDMLIGGFVGFNAGSIESSFAYGEASGSEDSDGWPGVTDGSALIGGLAGYNLGSIADSFFYGLVSGDDYVGGLVGLNQGDIINTYANVIAPGEHTGGKNIGGLVGSDEMPGIRSVEQPTVTASFWNTETSGLVESAGGVGKTSEELTSYFLYKDAGWDFIGETVNGTEGIWGINPDGFDSYPFLAWLQFKQIPVVITEEVSDVGVTSAVSSGVIVNIGEPESTEHGHVWGTSPEPTIDDSKTVFGQVVEGESYTSKLTDLTPNTTYYIRAYAVNEDYAAYGEELEFKTERQRLTISGFNAKDKVYDGNVVAQVSGIEFDGILVGHADFSIGSVTAEFNHQRAREDNTVAITSIELVGNDAFKYYVSLEGAPEVSAHITPKPLDLPGITGLEKNYDGTTEAQVDYGQLSGVVAGDTVTLDTSAANAHFADRHTGSNKEVSVTGLALAGADAGNYSIGDFATTGNILPKELTLPGLTIYDKVYDGTAEAEVADYGQLSGIVGDDDVTLVTDDVDASFATSQAGVDKQVTVRGLALTGQDADNYSISTATVRASILPRELTVAADAQRKFSGDADPELSYQIVDGDLVAGDELTGVLTREAGEEPGVYTIQLGTLANPNYQIDFIPAEFIIANSTFSISYSTSDIFVLGLENAIRLPELEQDDVIKVEVELVVDRLEVEHDTLFMATEALKDNNIDVLEAFNIKLIKTVYYVDGSSADFGVPNEDIIGSFKVQMPLLEEFEAKNPGIVYIDADGNVTEFASSPVTVDGKTYLEFETDHLSVYAMVGDVEAAGLTWLWILLGVVLVGGLILVGRKIIR